MADAQRNIVSAAHQSWLECWHFNKSIRHVRGKKIVECERAIDQSDFVRFVLTLGASLGKLNIQKKILTQIHVQSRHKKARVCRRSSEFPTWKPGRCFTVNVGVPLAIAYFQDGCSTKRIDIKNVVRHARDTFSMVCFPKQGSYGNGVPLGFGRSAAELS